VLGRVEFDERPDALVIRRSFAFGTCLGGLGR
jgi:hypothetical protein